VVPEGAGEAAAEAPGEVGPRYSNGRLRLPPPAVLESSARIGSPIVSQSPRTSGRAIAKGAKRERGNGTALAAESRLSRGWFAARKAPCRRVVLT
jgi:hypothetical protein